MTSWTTQIEKDFEVLRSLRKSNRRHPIWSSIRTRASAPISRWLFAAIPLSASWYFCESHYIRHGHWHPNPWFDVVVTLGTASLIAFLFLATRSVKRGPRHSLLMFGGLLSTAACAVPLAVIGLPWLAFFTICNFVMLVTGNIQAVLTFGSLGIGLFAPLGVGAVGAVGAARIFRESRDHMRGWSSAAFVGLGFILTIPMALAAMLLHLISATHRGGMGFME